MRGAARVGGSAWVATRVVLAAAVLAALFAVAACASPTLHQSHQQAGDSFSRTQLQRAVRRALTTTDTGRFVIRATTASSRYGLGDSIVGTVTVRNTTSQDATTVLSMELDCDGYGDWPGPMSWTLHEDTSTLVVPAMTTVSRRVSFPRAVYKCNGLFKLVASAEGTRAVAPLTVASGFDVVASFDATTVLKGGTSTLTVSITNNRNCSSVHNDITIYGDPASGGRGPIKRTVGRLDPGRTITLRQQLIFDCGGDQVISVMVSSPACGNARVDPVIAVREPTRLRMTSEVPRNVVVGVPFTIRATVENLGDITAENVVVWLTPRDGLTVKDSLSKGVGSLCLRDSREVSWTAVATKPGLCSFSNVAVGSRGASSSVDWNGVQAASSGPR